MSIKRFLILSILIVFVTVSCAGPNIVGWTKPDFRQAQFEKDRKECIDSIDKNLNSEAFGKALEECLAKKGYEYGVPAKSPKRRGLIEKLLHHDEKDTTIKTVSKVSLGVGLLLVILPVFAAFSPVFIYIGLEQYWDEQVLR